MTDHEPRRPSRPWTTGPWKSEETTSDPNRFPLFKVVTTDEDWRAPLGAWALRKDDASLIALAPEMAEAILGWFAEESGWAEDDGADHDKALLAVADKLHQIRAKNV